MNQEELCVSEKIQYLISAICLFYTFLNAVVLATMKDYGLSVQLFLLKNQQRFVKA